MTKRNKLIFNACGRGFSDNYGGNKLQKNPSIILGMKLYQREHYHNIFHPKYINQSTKHIHTELVWLKSLKYITCV